VCARGFIVVTARALRVDVDDDEEDDEDEDASIADGSSRYRDRASERAQTIATRHVSARFVARTLRPRRRVP